MTSADVHSGLYVARRLNVTTSQPIAFIGRKSGIVVPIIKSDRLGVVGAFGEIDEIHLPKKSTILQRKPTSTQRDGKIAHALLRVHVHCSIAHTGHSAQGTALGRCVLWLWRVAAGCRHALAM